MGGGGDDGVADFTVFDVGAVEVEAADDEPEVMEGAEGSGLAEDDEVEEAVVGPGGGCEGEAEGVSREVEDEDRGADQGFLAARVGDVDGDGGEAVAEGGAEDGVDVHAAMGGAGDACVADTGEVVAGDDLGIEAEAGHEGEAAVSGSEAEVDAGDAAGGDGGGELGGVASEAEMLGEEVFGAGGED